MDPLQPGVLQITLECARGLKNCNFVTKQNPYAVIRCGQVQLLSGTHKGGGKDPVWHEKFAFAISKETDLNITIFDKDHFTQDDFVGTATVDLCQARKLRHGRLVVPVYRGGKEWGSLSLMVNFTPGRGQSSPSFSHHHTRNGFHGSLAGYSGASYDSNQHSEQMQAQQQPGWQQQQQQWLPPQEPPYSPPYLSDDVATVTYSDLGPSVSEAAWGIEQQQQQQQQPWADDAAYQQPDQCSAAAGAAAAGAAAAAAAAAGAAAAAAAEAGVAAAAGGHKGTPSAAPPPGDTGGYLPVAAAAGGAAFGTAYTAGAAHLGMGVGAAGAGAAAAGAAGAAVCSAAGQSNATSGSSHSDPEVITPWSTLPPSVDQRQGSCSGAVSSANHSLPAAAAQQYAQHAVEGLGYPGVYAEHRQDLAAAAAAATGAAVQAAAGSEMRWLGRQQQPQRPQQQQWYPGSSVTFLSGSPAAAGPPAAQGFSAVMNSPGSVAAAGGSGTPALHQAALQYPPVHMAGSYAATVASNADSVGCSGSSLSSNSCTEAVQQQQPAMLELAGSSSAFREQLQQSLRQLQQEQQRAHEEVRASEALIEAASMAGGADAVRTITALGIANSKLRDALLQQDMLRKVLEFSLQELQKLDMLLETAPGLPAAEAAQLQQGVMRKLRGVIGQQQEQQAGDVAPVLFMSVSLVDRIRTSMAAAEAAAAVAGEAPCSREAWRRVLQEFNPMMPLMPPTSSPASATASQDMPDDNCAAAAGCDGDSSSVHFGAASFIGRGKLQPVGSKPAIGAAAPAPAAAAVAGTTVGLPQGGQGEGKTLQQMLHLLRHATNITAVPEERDRSSIGKTSSSCKQANSTGPCTTTSPPGNEAARAAHTDARAAAAAAAGANAHVVDTPIAAKVFGSHASGTGTEAGTGTGTEAETEAGTGTGSAVQSLMISGAIHSSSSSSSSTTSFADEAAAPGTAGAVPGTGSSSSMAAGVAVVVPAAGVAGPGGDAGEAAVRAVCEAGQESAFAGARPGLSAPAVHAAPGAAPAAGKAAPADAATSTEGTATPFSVVCDVPGSSSVAAATVEQTATAQPADIAAAVAAGSCVVPTAAAAASATQHAPPPSAAAAAEPQQASAPDTAAASGDTAAVAAAAVASKPKPAPLSPAPLAPAQAAAAEPGSSKPPPPPPPPPPPAKGAAAADAAAAKGPTGKAPPPPPPPPPGALMSRQAGSGAAELQLGTGVNVGAKAPPAAPQLGRSSSIGPISRVPGLVRHFQELRQGELAKQYGHMAGGGAGGAGRARARAAAAVPADPSQLINEIKRVGGHAAKVAADYEARRADIAKWAAEVRTFRPVDMQEVAAFVRSMDGKLDALYDECAVLRLFEDWPARYDTLKAAAAQYKQLQGLASAAKGFKLPAGASCQTVLSECSKQYDQLVWKVEQYLRDSDGTLKRFREAGVPWQGAALVDRVRASSLAYARVYMAAVTQEVHKLGLLQQPPHNLQQRQAELLVGAVNFVFRAHQFVSGLDTQTHQQYMQLADTLEQVKAGSFRPDPDAAAVGAGAAAAAAAAAASS